jgi:[ribosomal protein S5]-alanine N-acetyltransferase
MPALIPSSPLPAGPQARVRINTQRLGLLAPDPDPAAGQARAAADFYARNRAHFAPWDPPFPPEDNAAEAIQGRLVIGAAAFAAGQAHRWWLTPAAEPQRVIGSISLSNLSRGPFQSCTMGYALDQACQGQGLMHEALVAVIAEAFAPGINLHRIQAGVRPENQRSLALLARLGFADEGLARDYLYIAGAWRDHRLFAITNPAFIAPAGW